MHCGLLPRHLPKGDQITGFTITQEVGSGERRSRGSGDVFPTSSRDASKKLGNFSDTTPVPSYGELPDQRNTIDHDQVVA